MNPITIKRTLSVALVLTLFSAPVSTFAAEPKSPIKKTLDGKCLTPKHPDYWKTKIYIAKPSVEACVASGGQLVAQTD